MQISLHCHMYRSATLRKPKAPELSLQRTCVYLLRMAKSHQLLAIRDRVRTRGLRCPHTSKVSPPWRSGHGEQGWWATGPLSQGSRSLTRNSGNSESSTLKPGLPTCFIWKTQKSNVAREGHFLHGLLKIEEELFRLLPWAFIWSLGQWA